MLTFNIFVPFCIFRKILIPQIIEYWNVLDLHWKFVYGPGTDEEKRSKIEKALEAKTELQVEVQFYKKNGEKF